MGSEGPVLEATASASFQRPPGRRLQSWARGVHVAERPLPVNQLPPRAGPTVAPRARLLRTFGVAKVRKRAVSIGQHRGVPRRGRLREPGHDGRRYQSRSRGQRLAARWLATAPATRRRHGGYGRTFAEAECKATQALAVTQVPRCPRADHRAPSPELPFRRSAPTLCHHRPRPARLQGHEPRQRKRVDSETSARLPPRTPGLSRRPHRVNAGGARNGQSPGGRDPPL